MKNCLLLILLTVCFVPFLSAQTTAIPDSNFEDYLETHSADGGQVAVGDANSMGDGIANNYTVFTDRIANVTTLNLIDLGISNLSGIEDFDSLETLICNGNNLVNLDVSNNSNLKSLLCSSNQLPSLDIRNNPNLEDLDCSNNQIATLVLQEGNVAGNPLLKSLTCSNNRISDIDVSQNTDLTSLRISNNRISNLLVGNNVNLESLYCASNQLADLNLSANTYLKILDVSNNLISVLDLTTINTVACPDPQTDPVTICQGTSSINVSNNQLTSLIVANGSNDRIASFTSEGNPDLFCVQVDAGFVPNSNWEKDDWTYYAETTCTDIYTYVPDDNFEAYLEANGLGDGTDNNNLALKSVIGNELVLNISNQNIVDLTGIEDFIALQTFNCNINNIDEINLSNNTALTNFDASSNNLSNLDLTGNSGLTIIDLSNNTLENLDLSGNLSLVNLNCSNNNIQLLNLSSHIAITDFNCDSNALEALNLKNGQNTNLANFSAINNPNLSCIEIDTGAVPVGVNWNIDATASYAINCGAYVPDNAFENYLEMNGLGDGMPNNNYVPTASANDFVGALNIAGLGISDLTGIQNFLALTVLDCSNNNIVELNLTNNTALTSITCNNNALEFVDIRNGNNTNITSFNATNNPNLFCINVDANVIGNIPGSWTIDPTAGYNSDCENNRYTTIPDDNFEQALIDLGIDSGSLDNQVLTSSIEYLTSLDVSGENIESLKGIKAFLSLIELDCSNNYLDELDVSSMVNLENLYCGSNYFLTNNAANSNGLLNTTGTTNLTKLFCANNSLADLSISSNNNLEILDCSNNNLAALDISNNNNLVEVDCNNNQISNFISYAANNSSLEILSCNNNELSTLQVNRCLALSTLNCRSNTLTLLDISSNSALEVLDFSDNELTDINLSANSSLIALSGSKNQLTEIDDLSSAVLESLILDDNQINQLTSVLKGLSTIKFVSISNNQLTNLNVSSNTNLIELNVSNNELIDLQLPTNLNQLKTFNCSNNQVAGDFDLTTMGIGVCPTQNQNNPLDFCPDVITINLSGNQLEFVNIQNGVNNDISSFSATNNPNLTCIQVDDVNTIGDNWIKDVTTEYGLDCRFGETYVPDDNFEQALITLGHDVGPLDDYVATATIEVLANLDIAGNNISDLTGLQDFTGLQILNCSKNKLSTIEVNSNVNLVEINCSNNTLASLDLTENTNMVNVNIANNLFTEFDASLVSKLQIFNCDGNSIVELDFTTNGALTNLSCASNLLEVLDLKNGQNPSLSNLNAQNNPDLTCIQTDDGTAPGGVTWLKDAMAQYALDCHFGETYVPDNNFEQALIDLGYDAEPLDNYVPTSNIQNISFLNIGSKEISDLTGIEDFEGLTNLNFDNNIITTVDLSNNLLLNSIDASGNKLTDLDISNQPDLRVLNISNNSFTQKDFSSNFGLIELDVSGNRFTSLDVSLILDLRRLNCSSNQLTELDVTQNNKLIELFCSYNLFFQDKLNIKNGANEFLATFNASNNPDLSCILVDDPVAVISNVNGTYDDWYKDVTANYQSICDDADNDGVANVYDACPGTPFGEPVDLFGCTYSPLPENNFTVMITSETCLNNNDGKINISTLEYYNYTATLTKDDFSKAYHFTNAIDILNLLAGTYEMCITIEELPNFVSCYNVVISQPEPLQVVSSRSNDGGKISLNINGSTSYHVNFNGLEFTANDSNLTLSLQQGMNTLKISTDMACQGIYEENMFFSDDMHVYPNPVQDKVNVYLGSAKGIVSVNVYSYLGQMVYSQKVLGQENRNVAINTSGFAEGFYSVVVKAKSSLKTFKILKK